MFTFDPPAAFNPNEDGITHINIYSKARTELGRMLSNFAYSPFVYEPYGYFASAEAFWYWYLTGEQYDELRELSGYAAKKAGQKYRDDRLDVLGLTPVDLEIMEKMLISKIAYNPEIGRMLKESVLPLCHYYSYKGTVVVPDGIDWLSKCYTDIRLVLKEL